MRISDWSSDVCSSDLRGHRDLLARDHADEAGEAGLAAALRRQATAPVGLRDVEVRGSEGLQRGPQAFVWLGGVGPGGVRQGSGGDRLGDHRWTLTAICLTANRLSMAQTTPFPPSPSGPLHPG